MARMVRRAGAGRKPGGARRAAGAEDLRSGRRGELRPALHGGIRLEGDALVDELMPEQVGDAEAVMTRPLLRQRHLEVVVELMTDAQQRGFLRADLDPRSVATALNVINIGSNIIDVLGENGPKPEDWWNLILFFVNAMFPPQPSS